jgi:hypothetical protein
MNHSDGSMAGMGGDDILGRAQTQTPGLLYIKDTMKARGLTGRALTFGEAIELFHGAIAADGCLDKKAEDLSIIVLDYFALMGVPFCSALYFVAIMVSGRYGVHKDNLIKQAYSLDRFAKRVQNEMREGKLW